MIKLHPDWPEFTLPTAHAWNLPAPVDDLAYALGGADTDMPAVTPTVAGRLGETTEPFTLADIAEVTRYHVEYGGFEWTPGDSGGNELEMTVVGRLHDGRWFSVNAGNDYTGWGCQDYAHVHVADDWNTIWSQGLDKDGRRQLMVTVDAAPSRAELGGAS